MKKKENISTIMITDIVGYSKLSGDNQDVALILLKEHDKILFDSLKKYNGIVLKNRGDGVIAQFNKNIESLYCAIEIQRLFKRRNKLNVKERNFNIRIGIHYGEFVKDGNDIHGDCINIASKLEPLAPRGGIVISKELCKKVLNKNQVYIREYKTVFLDSAQEMIYEVYSEIFDWYKNKKNKKIVSLNDEDFLSKAHDLCNKSDYSAAIKNVILYKELFNNAYDNDIKIYLASLFLQTGCIDESKKIINTIDKNLIDDNLETKAHLLKLQGHIFFNDKKWSRAKKYFKNSLEIFKEKKIKYINEIYFYNGIIDLLNDEINNYILNEIDSFEIEDDFLQLINILHTIFSSDEKTYNINVDINRVETIENNKMKAYGLWLISKKFNQLSKIDKAYEFETESQKFLKLSSKDISDYYLRNLFLENMFLHKIITNETAISVDQLFDFEDEEDADSFDGMIDFKIFKYCINCGIQNLKEKQKCVSCDTILVKEYYEKN